MKASLSKRSIESEYNSKKIKVRFWLKKFAYTEPYQNNHLKIRKKENTLWKKIIQDEMVKKQLWIDWLKSITSFKKSIIAIIIIVNINLRNSKAKWIKLLSSNKDGGIRLKESLTE